MKIISNELVGNSYSVHELVDAVEASYRSLHEGEIIVPQRVFSKTVDGGDYLYGACTDLDKERYIVLGSAYMPWMERQGKPIVQGAYMYFSFHTGELLAVVAHEQLVNLRTGAKSAVVVRYLAHPGSSVLGLIGLGQQAVTGARAITSQVRLERIVGFSPNADNRKENLNKIKEQTGLDVEVLPLEAVIAEADILHVATFAKEPLFSFDDLHSGQLVISLAHSEEVSRDIVFNAKTFVDLAETAYTEIGPVKFAIEDGFARSDIAGSLGELTAGTVSGRENADEIIYFQSLGVMNENLALVDYFYEKLKDELPDVAFG